MDPSEFVGTYKVKQGGSNPPTEANISTLDTVNLTKDNPDRADLDYTITVTAPNRSEPLVFNLTWDPVFGSLGGNLAGTPSKSGRIVRVSFYAQDQEEGAPFPLKVLYGTIIDTDPDSAGAWSADDQ